MVQRIELGGKYAIGEHRFTQVDDSDFAWLNAWRWKAKPNGDHNNIYAIRSRMNSNEIAKASGVHISNVRKHMPALVRQRLITSHAGRGQGGPIIYSMAL